MKSKMSNIMSTGGNEKGIVLVATLLLVAILAIMGTVAAITTNTDIQISGNYKTGVQAFYIAEAGLQRAIGNLNAVTNWIGTLTNPTTINVFSGDNSIGNGTYDVKVFENDPNPGSVRIISTGYINGTIESSSSTTVEGIANPDYYDIFDYTTFNCGNLTLKESENNLISDGDVFVNGNVDLEPTGNQQIQNGNVYATGNININGISSIMGGNAFANGNIDVLSSANPNVGGNATAGGNISGSGIITGTATANVSPFFPVEDQCVGTKLAEITLTSEDIQELRDNATTTINDNYEPVSSIAFTDIVHITGNFILAGDATFSGNVVFIVDGNAEISGSLTSSPLGSSVTFIVPTGNFEVKGGGNFTIDGTILTISVNADGSNPSGGNIDVKDGSNLTVNGSVIAKGNTDTKAAGGSFTVNYKSPNDSNLVSSYFLTQWREVRN
ncbi:MAG: PilX N-terminal domain-containing pilus assembly protein [Candidatus Scalinduaceae bacterium]